MKQNALVLSPIWRKNAAFCPWPKTLVDREGADTHGQAEPVFRLAALLGITLMPRMRTWNDVTFYRVDHVTSYTHIDALFTQVVDWDVIERH